VKEALAGFRFDSPIGKDLRRFITAGVGVHHAGLLPKYRLLVEKLAQEGLLKIICGTDTLGVGVNVPIRSVLFTQLCKYDGSGCGSCRTASSPRSPAGPDARGSTTAATCGCRRPSTSSRTSASTRRRRPSGGKKKVVKKKQPERGYAHWTRTPSTSSSAGEPEPLKSHFQVSHQMVMNLLDRPVVHDADGTESTGAAPCAAAHRQPRDPQAPARAHPADDRDLPVARRAEMLEFPEPPDEYGRRVRVNFDLQDQFALHQPLSLWASRPSALPAEAVACRP
jgi:hypothetical protein